MCVGKWSGSGLEGSCVDLVCSTTGLGCVSASGLEGSCVDLVWSTTGLGCVSASGLEVVWKGLELI